MLPKIQTHSRRKKLVTSTENLGFADGRTCVCSGLYDVSPRLLSGYKADRKKIVLEHASGGDAFDYGPLPINGGDFPFSFIL